MGQVHSEDRLPSNGIQKGVVPSFKGWLQHFYLNEKTITVSQDGLESSGESSWSALFARMDIEAADVYDCGGPKRKTTSTQEYEINDRNQLIRPDFRPEFGDALFEDGSTWYGFSGAEFAALIILCGFTPRTFRLKRSHHSANDFGTCVSRNIITIIGSFILQILTPMLGLATHPGASRRKHMMFLSLIALNLAFGMIHVKGRPEREWVIPSESKASLGSWGAYASSQQLSNIRYTFELFVGDSGPAIAHYSQKNGAFEVDDVFVLKDLISSSGLVLETRLSDDDFRTRAREILNATHAIAAIRPWALLPVLPLHLVSAIKPILKPFFVKRADTVGVLLRELKMISNRTELSGNLNHIVGDLKSFFGNDCFQALTYNEAMSMVFCHQSIELDDVRVSLAAAVGRKFIWDKSFPSRSREVEERLEPFEEGMRQYLEYCYPPVDPRERSRNVPKWAVEVYGNTFGVGSPILCLRIQKSSVISEDEFFLPETRLRDLALMMR